jgi:hypothetical protein
VYSCLHLYSDFYCSMSAMKIRERKVAKFYYKSVYLFISFLVYPCFFVVMAFGAVVH